MDAITALKDRELSDLAKRLTANLAWEEGRHAHG